MPKSTSPLHPLRGGLFAAALLTATLSASCSAVSEAPDDLEDSGETESGVSNTVAKAAANSCGTASVKGLSRQIIEEARCMVSSAYTKVPDLGNVSFGSGVFPYLIKPARDKLVSALKSKGGTHMSVNSMLRTVAQQYLLYRWYQTGRCGIGLAAKPGASNHETGLAIDISQYSTWKGTLQAHGFKWLGSSDPVHFDYAGSGAKSYKGLDVKAFQRLWNRNHPGDKITVDGVWGPQTEARMKKSPAGGFKKGATCGSSQSFDEEPTLVAAETPDHLVDLPVADLFEDTLSEDVAAFDIDPALLDDSHADHPVEATAHAEVHAAEVTVSDADDQCATCFDAICAADPYCCETDWDARCVTTGMQICEALCGAAAMAPLE